MLSLSLLLFFSSFFPLPTLAISPVPVTGDIKIPGYAGFLEYPPRGDQLTTTYCYCSSREPPQRPQDEEDPAKKGSYFQYDYYNYHMNTTFVIQRACGPASDVWWELCANPYRDMCIPQIDWDCQDNLICAIFEREEEKIGKDELCFALDDHHSFLVPKDMIWFNGQKRSLRPKGSQGRHEQADADVQVLCEDLCERKAGMQVEKERRKPGKEWARSHQEVFGDLDDMCWGCKKKEME